MVVRRPPKRKGRRRPLFHIFARTHADANEQKRNNNVPIGLNPQPPIIHKKYKNYEGLTSMLRKLPKEEDGVVGGEMWGRKGRKGGGMEGGGIGGVVNDTLNECAMVCIVSKPRAMQKTT